MSRRKADELVQRGAVRVNRTVATPGQLVDPTHDVVTIDGRRIKLAGERSVTIILNKPSGVVTTMRDDRNRPNIARFLPRGPRLFPVGRLDADTTGLLICTNDGRLAQKLTHPSSQVPRTYRARTSTSPPPDAARALGVRRIKSASDGSATFEITLCEGKNRQVRRACAQQGLRVLELTRTKFGPLQLGDLGVGKTRPLTASERDLLAALLKSR